MLKNRIKQQLITKPAVTGINKLSSKKPLALNSSIQNANKAEINKAVKNNAGLDFNNVKIKLSDFEISKIPVKSIPEKKAASVPDISPS